jgi:hypothetical protein
MKLLASFSLMLHLLAATNLFSQSYNYETGYGFLNNFEYIVPLENERWLLVYQNTPQPGALFQDSVFVIVLDTSFEVLLYKRLSLPAGERYRVRAALPTPDGGFVLMVEKPLCDAGNKATMSAYHADGTLKWTKQNIDPNSLIQNSQDQGIWHLDNDLIKYDLATGNILSTHALNTGTGGSSSISDFVFHPSEQSFIALGGSLQRWDLQPDGSFLRVQTTALPTLWFPSKLVRNGPVDGWFYTFQKWKNQLYLVKELGLSLTLVGEYPFKIVDAVSMPSGLLVLAFDDVQTFLVRMDFDGIVTDTVTFFPKHLNGQSLAFQFPNKVAVGGENQLKFTDPFSARQVWANLSVLDNAPPAKQMEVALTHVYANAPLVVDSTFFTSQGSYFYKYSGGDYQAKVTNNGSDYLREISLFISHKSVPTDVCGFRPVNRETFSGLNVAPGESITLDFGDIQAFSQPEIPAELCFYATTPNQLPDLEQENNVFCTGFNVVSTGEPNTSPLTLWPNPARTWFRVDTPPGNVDNNAWQLVNQLGQIVQSGKIEPGISRLHIDITSLPRGVYVFQINGGSARVLVV